MSSWTIEGKRVVVTGATSGIGRSTALQLAQRGAEIVLMGRRRDRAQEVRAEVRQLGASAEIVLVDLASLASIEDAATVVSSGQPLTALVNNAGVVGRGITSDGLELTFGVNLVAAFHLTNLLLPALSRSPIRPRVVNVSSNAHLGAALPDFESLRSRTRSLFGVREYKASKLAMVAWSNAFRGRHPEIDVFCVHPGMAATPIWDIAPQPLRWYLTRKMLTPDEGARTPVRCAVDPSLMSSSVLYWAKEAPAKADSKALDEVVGERVWEWCERTIAEISAKAPSHDPDD